MNFFLNIITLVVGLCLSACGAPVKTDSLESDLLNASSVVEKIDDLNMQGYNLRNNDIKKAEERYVKAFELAKEVSYIKGLADAHYGLGLVQGRYSQLDSAKYHYQLAQTHYLQEEEFLGICRVKNSLGLLAYKRGNMALALSLFEEANSLNETLEDEELLVMINNNIGMVFKCIGETERALFHYQKSLEITSINGNLHGQSIILNNIGLLHETLGNHKLAIKYFNKSLEIRKKQGNKKGLAYPLHNIGLVYESLGNFDMALEYYHRSLLIKQEFNDQAGVAKSLNNIGVVYKSMGNYIDAEEFFNNALAIKKKLGVNSSIAHTLTNFGTLYRKQNKMKLAVDYYLAAERYAVPANSVIKLLNIYKGLYLCYKFRGNTEAALLRLEQFSSLKQQVLNTENNKHIANLEISYQSKEKEIENIRLKDYNQVLLSKVRLQYLLAIVLGIGFIMVVAIALILFRQKKQKEGMNKQLSALNEKIKTKVVELEHVNTALNELTDFKSLMTNMIIHDLKTPLNNIVNVKNLGDNDFKLNIIHQSGYEMLNLVQNIMDVYRDDRTQIKLSLEHASLRSLVDNAKNEVIFLAEQKNVNINFRTDYECVVFSDHEVVKRVFVNLLSNAVKFSPHGGEVEVLANVVDNNELRMFFVNQGPGIPFDEQELIFKPYSKQIWGKMGSTGLGLAFCKIAIEAHGGKIGVNSDGDFGVEFWLSIPNACIDKDIVRGDNEKQDELILTHEDSAYLMGFVKELKELKVYEITSINKILRQVKAKTDGIEIWKNQIMKAVFSADDDSYQKKLAL